MAAPRDILPLLDPPNQSGMLELFLSRLLELSEEWTRHGYSTDGVDYRVVESTGTRLRLRGVVWEITRQTQHHFWLEVEREQDDAEDGRWAFYFDLPEAAPRRPRPRVDVLTLPEARTWRIALSGRALIRERDVLLASVDGREKAGETIHKDGDTAAVHLTLKPPRHGWLPFRLRLGAFELVDDASAVLNDPVVELADCIVALEREEPGTSRICFWSEPGGYAVDIDTAPDGNVRVVVCSDPSFVPPMKKRRMRVEWSGVLSRQAVLNSLRPALEHWLESVNDNALAHWSAPAAEYRAELRRRLG